MYVHIFVVLFAKNSLLSIYSLKNAQEKCPEKYLCFLFSRSGETLLKKWMGYFELEQLTVAMIECSAE